MSDSLRLRAAKKNVQYYQRLLDVLLDASARKVAAQLLREAEAELAAATDEGRAVAGSFCADPKQE